MNKLIESTHRVSPVIFSSRLRRCLSCISQSCFVELNTHAARIVLTSQEAPECPLAGAHLPPDVLHAPGDLVGCDELPCDQQIMRSRTVEAGLPAVPTDTTGRSWHCFRMIFAGGIEDRISVLVDDGAQKVTTKGLLTTIWPILREDCLQDLSTQDGEVGDKALLWMIDAQINMAVLVMNKEGKMLRSNAAAKQLMDQETVLRRTPKGIRCVNDAQTRAFRNGLSECTRSALQGHERIVFLDSAIAGMRIPVTLSRYHHLGAPTDLVLVAMPLPPDSRRVEMLARAGGLTPAEARIASLLQMGLSNKDAAIAAGLKEQSVSTYAKRVLSKLNVTSRADMAQLLTWQAAGGRLS